MIKILQQWFLMANPIFICFSFFPNQMLALLFLTMCSVKLFFKLFQPSLKLKLARRHSSGQKDVSRSHWMEFFGKLFEREVDLTVLALFYCLKCWPNNGWGGRRGAKATEIIRTRGISQGYLGRKRGAWDRRTLQLPDWSWSLCPWTFY